MTKNFKSLQFKCFLLGIIDGVIKGIEKDINKIKYIDPYSVKILEEEQKKWYKEGEIIFNQIQGMENNAKRLERNN